MNVDALKSKGAVIAIDPGPKTSAYVVLENGLIDCSGEADNEGILVSLREARVDHMAIESVSCMGMAVGADVFETVWWTGRFCQCWGRPFTRIKRHEVKMFLCNNMRAKDANIRQALIDRLGPPGTMKNKGPTYGISKHRWSALAIAVTFLERPHELP
jgi:hypothetical protein